MKNVINCLVNHNEYINSKLKEVSVEEGLVIAEELFQILNKRGDGIGLAANQVGIDAQVAVVNVREPLVLINPKIVSKETEIPFYEGCLSYPGKGVHTKRYRDVIISTEQSESDWYFSGAENIIDNARGSWEKERKTKDQELRILESVCVQHEIDHLNGLTIYDREFKRESFRRTEVKIGRNEKVTITKDKETLTMKYKKAIPYLEKGWIINGH